MSPKKKSGGKFFIEFRNMSQKLAWASFQQNEVLFLTGPAGTAKTYLAVAFAIHECLQEKKKIIICRPIVEAGESLGFLPGEIKEKVDPYMRPIFDSINKLVGIDGEQKERVTSHLEIAPLAYMRGRTLDNATCILDEAQNATQGQLILFLTRLGENSKMLITGDLDQSDIMDSGLMDMTRKLDGLPNVGMVKFSNADIVRNPLVGKILERLGIGNK